MLPILDSIACISISERADILTKTKSILEAREWIFRDNYSSDYEPIEMLILSIEHGRADRAVPLK